MLTCAFIKKPFVDLQPLGKRFYIMRPRAFNGIADVKGIRRRCERLSFEQENINPMITNPARTTVLKPLTPVLSIVPDVF